MWFVLLTPIHWIEIYPVDSVIQPSNNWGQEHFSSPPPPPGQDASPSQGYPAALALPLPIYSPARRDALHMEVRCLTQEPNTMTWTTLSRDNEATASPMQIKLVRPCIIIQQLVRQFSMLPIVEVIIVLNVAG